MQLGRTLANVAFVWLSSLGAEKEMHGIECGQLCESINYSEFPIILINYYSRLGVTTYIVMVF